MHLYHLGTFKISFAAFHFVFYLEENLNDQKNKKGINILACDFNFFKEERFTIFFTLVKNERAKGARKNFQITIIAYKKDRRGEKFF